MSKKTSLCTGRRQVTMASLCHLETFIKLGENDETARSLKEYVKTHGDGRIDDKRD
jgi:hypothetical protein